MILSDVESDEESTLDEMELLPFHNSSSLQQNWSKVVQPNVTKFIGLTECNPKRSGEGMVIITFVFFFVYSNNKPFPSDAEQYYNCIHLMFLEQNPDVKSFDLYQPSWEYLKESAKFATICLANTLPGRASGSKRSSPPGEENIAPISRPVGKKQAK